MKPRFIINYARKEIIDLERDGRAQVAIMADRVYRYAMGEFGLAIIALVGNYAQEMELLTGTQAFQDQWLVATCARLNEIARPTPQHLKDTPIIDW